MKRLLVTLVFISSFVVSNSQNDHIEYNKQGDLIEATYYYEDGTIQQQGTFKDGKLHGVWTSYDFEGNKLAMGNYENGKKVGKWLFWTKESLKEVDYLDSKILSVNEWSDKTKVAVRN